MDTNWEFPSEVALHCRPDSKSCARPHRPLQLTMHCQPKIEKLIL